MLVIGVSNVVTCRVLFSTLIGWALEWFKILKYAYMELSRYRETQKSEQIREYSDYATQKNTSLKIITKLGRKLKMNCNFDFIEDYNYCHPIWFLRFTSILRFKKKNNEYYLQFGVTLISNILLCFPIIIVLQLQR